MVKKVLFVLFLFFSVCSFAQQSAKNNTQNKQLEIQNNTIDKISAFPNPFKSKTHISFVSSKQQTVFFSVKNLLGKKVYSVNYKAKKGRNNIPFYRAGLTSGMYIYAIQTNTELISKRLVIK